MEIRFQGTVMQAAEGHGIGLAVEREPAHEVDGGLEHRHPIQGGVAGQAEGHAFVAANGVPLEAGKNTRLCILSGISPEPVVYVQCLLLALAALLAGALVFQKSQDRFVLYL